MESFPNYIFCVKKFLDYFILNLLLPKNTPLVPLPIFASNQKKSIFEHPKLGAGTQNDENFKRGETIIFSSHMRKKMHSVRYGSLQLPLPTKKIKVIHTNCKLKF
jgi:hypothetical protein